jgi:hypothetical protein
MSNFPAAATGYPTPTTGSGVSAQLAITSTQTGASALTSLPNSTSNVRQYTCTLSKTGTGANSAYSTSIVLNMGVQGAQGASVTPATSINAVWKPYCSTSAVNAKQSPSNFSQTYPAISYSAYTFSVGSPSQANNSRVTVTAQNPGNAVLEVQFPTFANTEGSDTNSGDPTDMIYAQVVIQVLP